MWSKFQPRMVTRSVWAARRLAQPTLARPLLIERCQLDNVLLRSALPFHTVNAVMEAIKEYCIQRSTRQGHDEYNRVFAKVPPATIANTFLSSIVASSLQTIASLAAGRRPTSSDVAHVQQIEMTQDFNTAGVYLHVGRTSEQEPFQDASYCGSAAGECGKSAYGMSGLCGVVRRVVAQHSNSLYRAYEQKVAAKRGRSVLHYEKMFEASEEASDHLFISLLLIPFYETKQLLCQPAATGTDKVEEAELSNERKAVVKIFETAFFSLLGLFRQNVAFNEILNQRGIV